MQSIAQSKSSKSFVLATVVLFISLRISFAEYPTSYNSSMYTLTEEKLSNYNEIGTTVGVHWLAYEEYQYKITIPLGDLSKDDVEIPVDIEFDRSRRPSITTVNTYDPVTNAEKQTTLPKLSDIPSLRFILNVHRAGTPYKTNNCLASAYVLKGKGGESAWNKPLIVADGFDPRNRIGIQEILERVDNSLAPGATNFIETVLERGNDVIFVDFGYGAQDIGENACVLLKVIEEVCARASGHVHVAGYSMGGLIARTALLLGERSIPDRIRRVKKFVSIDAPHLGAQVNLDMQKKIMDIADNWYTKPSNAIAYSGICGSVHDLRTPAARQMLFSHGDNSEHAAFYSYLMDLGGYPSARIQKYAIATAAWKWPYPSANLAGEKAVTFNGADLYVRHEDLFPGSFIDLWAVDTDKLIPSPFTILPANISSLLEGYVGIKTMAPSNPTYGDKRYKPTHMPLYSALGIDKERFLQIDEPKTQVELNRIAQKYSQFDKIYLASFDRRAKHIEFDEDLMGSTQKCLIRPSIDAVIWLLLD
ncbi:MAG: hypothetical protein GF344_16650 [Chitinivibrionales bacterium]|nr:hypothetical protein [Chitinivibrionales bacterium]